MASKRTGFKRGAEVEDSPQVKDLSRGAITILPNLKAFPLKPRECHSHFHLLLPNYLRKNAGSLSESRLQPQEVDAIYAMILEFIVDALGCPQAKPVLITKSMADTLVGTGAVIADINNSRHPKNMTHKSYQGTYYAPPECLEDVDPESRDGDVSSEPDLDLFEEARPKHKAAKGKVNLYGLDKIANDLKPCFTIIVETLISESTLPPALKIQADNLIKTALGSAFDPSRSLDSQLDKLQTNIQTDLFELEEAAGTPINEIFRHDKIPGFLITVITHDPQFKFSKALFLQTRKNQALNRRVTANIKERLVEAKLNGESADAPMIESGNSRRLCRLQAINAIKDSIDWCDTVNQYRKHISTRIHGEGRVFDDGLIPHPDGDDVDVHGMDISDTPGNFLTYLFKNWSEIESVLNDWGVCKIQRVNRLFNDGVSKIYSAPIPSSAWVPNHKEYDLLEFVTFPHKLASKICVHNEFPPGLEFLAHNLSKTGHKEMLATRIIKRMHLEANIEADKFQFQERIGHANRGLFAIAHAIPSNRERMPEKSKRLKHLLNIIMAAFDESIDERGVAKSTRSAVEHLNQRAIDTVRPKIVGVDHHYAGQDLVGDFLHDLNFRLILCTDVAYNQPYLVLMIIAALSTHSNTINNNSGDMFLHLAIIGGHSTGKTHILKILQHLLLPDTHELITDTSNASFFYHDQSMDLCVTVMNECDASLLGKAGPKDDPKRTEFFKEFFSEGYYVRRLTQENAVTLKRGLMTQQVVSRKPHIVTTNNNTGDNALGSRWVRVFMNAGIMVKDEQTAGAISALSTPGINRGHTMDLKTRINDLQALKIMADIWMELGLLPRPSTELLNVIIESMNSVTLPGGRKANLITTRMRGQIQKLYSNLVVLGAIRALFRSPIGLFVLPNGRGADFDYEMLLHLGPYMMPSVTAAIYSISVVVGQDISLLYAVLQKFITKLGFNFPLLREWVRWSHQCQVLHNNLIVDPSISKAIEESRDPKICTDTVPFDEVLAQIPQINTQSCLYTTSLGKEPLVAPLHPAAQKLISCIGIPNALLTEQQIAERDLAEKVEVRFWNGKAKLEEIPRDLLKYVPETPEFEKFTLNFRENNFVSCYNRLLSKKVPCLPFAIDRMPPVKGPNDTMIDGPACYNLDYIEFYLVDTYSFTKAINDIARTAQQFDKDTDLVQSELLKKALGFHITVPKLGKVLPDDVPETLAEFAAMINYTKMSKASSTATFHTIPVSKCTTATVNPEDPQAAKFIPPPVAPVAAKGPRQFLMNHLPTIKTSQSISTLFLLMGPEALQENIFSPHMDKMHIPMKNVPLAHPDTNCVPTFQTVDLGPGERVKMVQTQMRYTDKAKEIISGDVFEQTPKSFEKGANVSDVSHFCRNHLRGYDESLELVSQLLPENLENTFNTCGPKNIFSVADIKEQININRRK